MESLYVSTIFLISPKACSVSAISSFKSSLASSKCRVISCRYTWNGTIYNSLSMWKYTVISILPWRYLVSMWCQSGVLCKGKSLVDSPHKACSSNLWWYFCCRAEGIVTPGPSNSKCNDINNHIAYFLATFQSVSIELMNIKSWLLQLRNIQIVFIDIFKGGYVYFSMAVNLNVFHDACWCASVCVDSVLATCRIVKSEMRRRITISVFRKINLI